MFWAAGSLNLIVPDYMLLIPSDDNVSHSDYGKKKPEHVRAFCYVKLKDEALDLHDFRFFFVE
ncbi:hypothetical protein GCM10011339_06280 [Echinicola rosea]|uniref:Uncharacterized protein n=1 Tax=Echinicola rosea TaxID=1807691 RepID=A0ABQ1ULK3_9BACT|nr:hypothetical protein GCM10011339_06280 [Echinicola rosea]